MTSGAGDPGCSCEYADRAAVRASPFDACPLCGGDVGPLRRYAETMRRPYELLAGGRPARVTRSFRNRR
jgi:hypothetical protein